MHVFFVANMLQPSKKSVQVTLDPECISAAALGLTYPIVMQGMWVPDLQWLKMDTLWW